MTRSAISRFEKRGGKKARKQVVEAPLSLEDDLLRIGMAVPPEDRAKLPRDFNENLDHYLYGAPKKKPRRG